MLPFVPFLGGLMPSYLLINSFGFCACIFWITGRAKSWRPTAMTAAFDAMIATMLGGFVGARLFHVLFERPDFYLAHPSFIFKIWYGGYVFYGGLMGGALAGVICCRVRRLSPLVFADLIAPALPLGYAVGRLGCLAAGCCYGKPTSLPWAIHFPPGAQAPPFVGLHPTQIYSSLGSVLILAILLIYEKARPSVTISHPGRTFGLWLSLQSVLRFDVEWFRDDFRGPNVFNLSIGTWLSFVAFGTGLWLMTYKRENKNASTSISTTNS